jgi:hypothetical protein
MSPGHFDAARGHPPAKARLSKFCSTQRARIRSTEDAAATVESKRIESKFAG